MRSKKVAESFGSSKIITIFADETRLTSPGNTRDNMDKVQYDAAAFRLKRLIKAIFNDDLVRIGIDDYDDVMKTECIIEPFSNVYVVASGLFSRVQLSEMAWYGCNLDFISGTGNGTANGTAIRFWFDCREFINDLNDVKV